MGNTEVCVSLSRNAGELEHFTSFLDFGILVAISELKTQSIPKSKTETILSFQVQGYFRLGTANHYSPPCSIGL